MNNKSYTIITLCSFCNKVKNENGSWERVDVEALDGSEFLFSHGVCQDCAQRHYPKWFLKPDKTTK